MPKSRPPYPPEFRRRIVELVGKGRTPEELARQFEPSAQAIRQGGRYLGTPRGAGAVRSESSESSTEPGQLQFYAVLFAARLALERPIEIEELESDG
jgi:transposase-like protein